MFCLFIELIAKIVPEVWLCLPFSSKMTFLYHFAPNVLQFLPFSPNSLTWFTFSVNSREI
ncbi:hypothetical protein Hanom_Chr04g00296551 [Helianthus anomalus]